MSEQRHGEDERVSHLKTREKSNPSRQNTCLGGSGLRGTCVCEEDGAESGEEGGEVRGGPRVPGLC